MDRLSCSGPVLAAFLDEVQEDVERGQGIAQLGQHDGQFSAMMRGVDHGLGQHLPDGEDQLSATDLHLDRAG